jgi:hypothetical protein
MAVLSSTYFLAEHDDGLSAEALTKAEHEDELLVADFGVSCFAAL